MYMFMLAFGSIPELEGEWWVIALLGVLTILFIVTIVFMFSAAYGSTKPKEEEQPKKVPEESQEEEQPEEEPDEPQEEEGPEEQPDEPEEEEGLEDIEEEAESVKSEAEPLPIDPTAASLEYTTVYNKSFMARLSQADDDVKAKYNEIKNYILSYKKVKARVSWGFDSFNSGRKRLIRIQCKGKRLVMYMALNPLDLDRKYRVKDVGDVSRYEEVPAMIKIKSERSLKYAKELVDKLMAKNELVLKAAYGSVDYTVPYMETEDLIANGLIKTRLAVKRSFNR